MPEKRMAAVAVAFTLGILVANYASFAGCALIGALVAFAVLLFAPSKQRGTFLLLLAITIGGAWRFEADISIALDDISNFTPQISAFEGSVVSDVTDSSDSIRLPIKVDRIKIQNRWQKASGKVMVSFYKNDSLKQPNLNPGNRLRITVRPYIPYEPSNPGQFSWKNHLARRGIYACASVRNWDDVTVLEQSRATNIINMALAAKRYLVSSIERIHPPREATVMCGIVLGTYSYLDDETLRDFTRTGTLHVLAASGYNCFILLILTSPLLKLLRVFPKYRGIITIFLLGIYLLIVGPAPSLVRAAIMASLVLLAMPFKRIPDYTNLFYVAGFLVLLCNPSHLFDIGFQLSFLAVWALIVVIPVIDSLMSRSSLPELKDWKALRKRRHWIIKVVTWARIWLVGLIASTTMGTLAVSLVTGPVVAYYFNYISIATLPANLAVAFVEPVVFFDSFISAITSLVPHSSGWIGSIGTISTRFMLSAVHYLGALKYSSIAIPSPGVLGIIGYYIILWAGAGYVRSRFDQR